MTKRTRPAMPTTTGPLPIDQGRLWSAVGAALDHLRTVYDHGTGRDVSEECTQRS